MTTEPQALTPTTMEALREELARVRAELAEYVGHEPTVAEEMQHLSDDNMQLRKAVALLMTEYAEKTTVDLWDDDLNSMTGRLEMEPSPGYTDRTRITYTRFAGGQALPPLRPRKPINHREQAEKHASQAAHLKSDREHHPIDPVASDFHLRMAMVHATLARADENTADQTNARDALILLRRREYAVRELVSTHIAQGLASREPKRWKAAVDLAKALDEGDANMDDLIDRWLTDEGWDARSAWKTPASATRSDDPWAASPDIAEDIPVPVRRVIAGQLASMLLSTDGEAVQGWARNLATALKNEGADLDDAIKTRIYELTLGHTDAPF
jgi:hypothetical protein